MHCNYYKILFKTRYSIYLWSSFHTFDTPCIIIYFGHPLIVLIYSLVCGNYKYAGTSLVDLSPLCPSSFCHFEISVFEIFRQFLFELSVLTIFISLGSTWLPNNIFSTLFWKTNAK